RKNTIIDENSLDQFKTIILRSILRKNLYPKNEAIQYLDILDREHRLNTEYGISILKDNRYDLISPILKNSMRGLKIIDGLDIKEIVEANGDDLDSLKMLIIKELIKNPNRFDRNVEIILEEYDGYYRNIKTIYLREVFVSCLDIIVSSGANIELNL